MKHPFRLESAGVHVGHAKTATLAKAAAESLSNNLISDVDVYHFIRSIDPRDENNPSWRSRIDKYAWVARFREGVLIEGSI